jgi:TIR domain-containing protein
VIGQTSGSPPVPTAGERLGVSAAYPPEVALKDWTTLTVALHRGDLQERVGQLLRHRVALLGYEQGDPDPPGSPLRGTTVTVTPYLPGITVNPAAVEVGWYEDVTEVTFRMFAPGPLRRGTFTGTVEVSAGPWLVAVVPVEFRLRPRPNRTRTDHAARVSTAPALGRIYAAYHRQDSSIVDIWAGFYRALGVDVVLDRDRVGTGDDARIRAHQLIDHSDVCQVFWSAAAAGSPEVEHEWRYALNLIGKGPRFIRPVSWESPGPPVPAELAALPMARLDLDRAGPLGPAGTRTGR